MASKVKLIIECYEQTYEECKRIQGLSETAFVIANGTPLPKGHGDLIDRDELSPKIHGAKSIVAVLEAPAIVEADKENDNES